MPDDLKGLANAVTLEPLHITASLQGTSALQERLSTLEAAREKYRLGELDAAGSLLDTLAVQPTDRDDNLLASVCVLRGQLLFDRGDVGGSEKEFRRAIELLGSSEPEPNRRSADLGIALSGTGKRELAIRYLQRAVEAGPKEYWDASRWLGLAYLTGGDPSAAIRPLRVAVERMPQSASVRVALGRAIAEGGKRARDAVVHLRRAAELTPTPDDAEQLLLQAIDLQPQNVETLWRLGKLYSDRDDLATARSFFERSLRLDPQNIGALVAKADFLVRTGNPDEARELVRQAAKLAPDNPPVRQAQIDILERIGDYRGEIEALDSLQSFSVDFEAVLQRKVICYVRLEEWNAALECLAGPLERDPNSSRLRSLRTTVMCEWGRVMRSRDRFDEALSIADEGLKNDPDDGSLLLLKAQVLGEMHSDDRLAEHLARCVRVVPPLSWAWEQLLELDGRLRAGSVFDAAAKSVRETMAASQRSAVAEILARLASAKIADKDRERAIDLYECAVEFDPTSAEMWADLARPLGEEGRDEKAIAAYDRALEIKPEDPRALVGKAWILLKRKGSEAAVEDLLKPAAEKPGEAPDPILLALYGDALRRRRHWEKGRVEMNRAMKIAPSNPWVLGKLAELENEVGEFREAAAHAEMVAAKQPSPWIYGVMGWSLENFDENERALSAYQTGLKLDQGDPWLRKGVANAYRRLGNDAKARAEFEKIIEDASKETVRSAEYSAWLLGWCHYQVAKYDEAARLISSAVASDPDSLYQQFDLGLVLLVSGRATLGRDAYERAFKSLNEIDHPGCKRAVLHVASSDVDEALGAKPSAEVARELDVVRERMRILEAGLELA